MKIIKIILFLILITFFSAEIVFSQEIGNMRLSMIEGDVQIYTPDTRDWVPAITNMPLTLDDRIWVPERGRAEVHIKGGIYIRLDSNTSMDILSTENNFVQIFVVKGRIYINNTRGRNNIIQVDTPITSVSVPDNSIVIIEVLANGATEVSALRGNVYVESLRGKTLVSSMSSLYIDEDRYARISPIGPSDEWERWNRQRDKKLIDYPDSARYLPEELQEYSYEFTQNGRWVYTRDYGYVWTPTVIISVGWAPYKHGRWVWIRGHYVWIPYETWGWVPHHYGRWTFIIGIGWCWVPPVRGEVYWGPGYVAWVYTPYYVGWVPLAPREIYYGYGYYGPWSVNIININIQQVVIKHDYKNINVRNAVTVIHIDKFIKGKDVDYELKENPFKKEGVKIGPPDIKPEKETVMPIIKTIPESKRPPERIREIKLEDIRKERRRTKDPEASIFKPEVKPEKMPVEELDRPRRSVPQQMHRERSDIEKKVDIGDRTQKRPDSEIDESRGIRRSSKDRQNQPDINQKVNQTEIQKSENNRLKTKDAPDLETLREMPLMEKNKKKIKPKDEEVEKEGKRQIPIPSTPQ